MKMSSFLFELQPVDVERGLCPHCKAEQQLQGFKVNGINLVGRFFLGISPSTPLFECAGCSKLSQRLTGVGKASMVVAWLPLILGLLYINYLAEFKEMTSLIATALATLVALFMMVRIFRYPLYPVAGCVSKDESGRTVWGRAKAH